jgi:hypothetical protein
MKRFQAPLLYKNKNYFVAAIPDDLKNLIATTLGVNQVIGTCKYLGLPSMIGTSKHATFKFIKNRIWSKINSWSSRYLSQAKMEIIIKSVLQSIPSYVIIQQTLEACTGCLGKYFPLLRCLVEWVLRV